MRQKRTLREDIRGSISMSAGWLFADLLLVLAMLFLAANTMGTHPPPPTPTATPTPNAAPELEQAYHSFTVNVDTQKLLASDGGATNSLIQQITSQPFLKGRSAGLIIAYGGAPTVDDIETALHVSQKVYDIVLGKLKSPRNSTFSNIVQYKPLYTLGAGANTIGIDIFLFAPGHS